MSRRDPESAFGERPTSVQWSLGSLFGLMAVIAFLCTAFFTLDLLHFLKSGGIVGLAVLATGVFLIPLGMVLLFVARTRTAFLIYGAMAVLPIVIGLFGTWIGHLSIQKAARQLAGGVNQEILDEGYRVAWSTTHMGLTIGVSVLVIAGIGLLCLKRAPAR